MADKEIDTFCTDNIVCPWCGHEDLESWELEGDSADAECPECQGVFHYEREISVHYTTSRPEEPS